MDYEKEEQQLFCKYLNEQGICAEFVSLSKKINVIVLERSELPEGKTLDDMRNDFNNKK